MENLLENQNQLMQGIEQILRNFKKDGPERKTPVYIKKRLETLDAYWEEFQMNHTKLLSDHEDRSYSYFSDNQYQKTKQFYNDARIYIQKYKATLADPKVQEVLAPKSVSILEPEQGQYGGNGSTGDQNQSTSSYIAKSPSCHVSQGSVSKLEEMLRKQKSNFKAFSRTITSIDLESISEKWEFEDVLKSVQARWSTIDSLHWEIDSELFEENEEYDLAYNKYEKLYIDIKKSINTKMWSVAHREKSTPKMDIPIFNGNYHQWVPFKDLFTEAIHENRSISNAQKMQFLKSKLRGEAERLIQHLHISTDNYQVCWDILNHRYNNKKLIFSSHIHILLSLPTLQQQSAIPIKKMYDTTNECLNAIKNLGVDITTWDPLVVHILSQKLDSQTHNDYIDSLSNPRDLPALRDFLEFLENKFTSLESSRRKQDTPKQDSFRSHQESYNKKPNFNKFNSNQNVSNKSFFNNSATKKYTSTQNCPLCSENHRLFSCKTFLESPADMKHKTVNKLNLCKNCLYDHKGKVCFSEKRCRQCQGNHNTLLHDSFSAPSNTGSNTSASKEQRKNVTHISNEDIIETLLATAQIKIKAANGSYCYMRALIDQGSQLSLISENAAQRLGLPRQSCKGIIFGVGKKAGINCKGVISVEASAIENEFTFHGDLYIMKSLINNLPNKSFEKVSWGSLNNIQMADPEYNLSRPIDILLGADIYSLIIMEGIIKESKSQLVAQQTRLGWILCGNVKSYQCNVVLNNIDDIQRFWAIEDVNDTNTELSDEDQKCIQKYKSETTRREDGRYIVRLPLKPTIQKMLGESKNKAIAQFCNLENKFSRNKNMYTNYKSFMNEYIELGHMQECAPNKNNKGCYLPHHCVIRTDSITTALRVVFNASAKTSSGFSLNDLMYSDPNLQQDLFTLILRWRKYEFAFTADIEKMFRQIICHEKDTQYQKIIWRDSRDQHLREYELSTVTYGTKAAPFLAMMTLKQLASDERIKYPAAAKVLEEEFFMDDVLSGQETLHEAKQLQKDLIALLRSGGFNLRKWSSNKIELLEDVSRTDTAFNFRHQETTKALGLQWCPSSDQFTFLSKIKISSSIKITKRTLLSNISKIFDPLGWLSPVTTKLKLIFQRVWQQQLLWDDQVPEDIIREWSSITQDLQHINRIKLPRWLGSNKDTIIELHGFCDSSTKAYACVIYSKIKRKDKDTQNSHIILVAGKARLVPMTKNITLPRLELSAAFLLSKLMHKVRACLTGYELRIFAWSDSTAVLGWLQGDPNRWKPFVANRVKQVTEIIPSESWRYVKSADNPADCASRGMSVEQLQKHSLWWNGPSWLSSLGEYQESKEYPVYNTFEEMKKSAQINVAIQNQQNDVLSVILSKHSSFTKATRVLAWILRALSRSRQKPAYLTIIEMRKAKYLLVKHTQSYEFAEDINNLHKHSRVDSKSKLISLNPYIDTDGLLRVGGRLSNARINQNMQHPLIIPHSGHFTDIIIEQAHKMTYHGGARLTLAWVRREFWIIGGNRAVKKYIRSCVKCRRHSPIKHTQIMGDLPASRSNPTRPFYHTGVDFTGYVDVKSSKGRGIKTTKGYIAVFVCMATKAVHLELVSDLSSASFLASLRRMAARRGAPSHIYSDNGTNFVGASKILNEEFINLQKTLDLNFYTAITEMQIQWHFNAPSWPHAGGLWEAAVKSLKHHIKRVIGDQKLTYEEYSTLLTQLEACLNTRPLCTLSEDPEDMDYLTPSHFLASGPTLTIFETEKDTRTRWMLTQKIFDDIWKRWKVEYLCQLSSRSKWQHKQPNVQINDIVIVNDANLPPGKWALGKITELHPGKDGYVRVVSVRTKTGIIKRPITKISLLPVTEKEVQIQNSMNQNDTTTMKELPASKIQSNNEPSDRNRRPRKICNYIYLAIMFFMLIISPAKCDYKLANLNNSKSIYFDKVANMRLERDEWKLIIYYDMEPYWRGSDLLKKYITHLDSICSSTKNITQCDVILMQLRHGCAELEHYNSMLLDQQFPENMRHKRGLVNAIGNIARSLFGVLDEDFAQQYQKDIELIRTQQKHLSSLWKNQTSIVEAENNIIKRVENAMDKHYKVFNQQLISLEKGINTLQGQVQESLIINSFSISSIIANSVLLNLRSIQDTLVDTVMNIHFRGFNIHLLTPDQLRQQFNVIIGQLDKDLSLPINNIQSDLSKIYHLLKTKARVMKRFIIFEVKIPLVSRDSYEIYNVIPIPQQVANNMISIIPIANQIAMNIQKDLYIPLSQNDMQNCIPYDTETQMCRLKHPIYQMSSDKNLCRKDKQSNQCKTQSLVCTTTWTELYKLNTYLYFCCGQCTVRVICEYQVTAEQLTKAGIITLSSECVIKGSSYTVYSHKTRSNLMNTAADVIKIDIPPINNIINLSIPISAISYEDSYQDHHETQDLIKQTENQLKQLKSEDSLADSMSYHDIHHYILIYLVVSAAGVAAMVYVWRRWRRMQSAALTAQPDLQLHNVISVPCVNDQSGSSVHELKTISGIVSARKHNKASSPVFRQTVFTEQ